MKTIHSEITIETHETYVIRRRRNFLRAWCDKCNREIGMVSPADASFLSGRNLQTIEDLMKSDLFHLSQTEDGKQFICISSLCFL